MPVVSIASNQIWLMILNKAIIQILQNENIKGKYSNFESEEDSDGKELKKPDTFEEISDHIKSNMKGKRETLNIPLNEFNLDNMTMFQNVNKQQTIKFQDNKNLR